MSKAKPILELSNIDKSYPLQKESIVVLKQIDLSIVEGEIVSVLGHSGCGKTTLLRIITQLEQQENGQVLLEGAPYMRSSKHVLMIFQGFDQLLPWKTVEDNIVHPLRAIGQMKEKAEAKRVAREIIKEVGLEEFSKSYPAQLSGGMKQRVALARALAMKPKVLVMDEPFASLDLITRKKLQTLTRDECKKQNITVVFVTHDVEEAIRIADRIVIMKSNPGRIKAILDNTVSLEDERQQIDKISNYLE